MDLFDINEQPLDDAIDNAKHMIKLLCTGKKKWMMSIPPQNDDPDVVFATLVREARRYMKQIEEIRQEEGRKS